MGESSSSADQLHADGRIPGEVPRGLISLWIIVHFVGIALAIFTQNEWATVPGAADELSRSQLLHRVKQAPPLDQYLFALWLDVPYGYPLATGGLFDADHTLELTLIDAHGKRSDPIVWPSENVWFGERRERLARLAQQAHGDATRGGSTLAAAIGRGLLRNTDAKEVEISVYRRQPISIEDARSRDAARNDPRHERTRSRVYQATVRLDANGDPEVKQAQEALDVAPPAARNNSPASDADASPSQPNRPPRRQQRAAPLADPQRERSPVAPPGGIIPPLDRPSNPLPPFRQ